MLRIKDSDQDDPGPLDDATRDRVVRWLLTAYVCVVGVFAAISVYAVLVTEGQNRTDLISDLFELLMGKLQPVLLIALGYYFGKR